MKMGVTGQKLVTEEDSSEPIGLSRRIGSNGNFSKAVSRVL